MNGFKRFVDRGNDAGIQVQWLDTQRDLWSTLRMTNSLGDGGELLNADELVALANTVAEK